MLMTPVSERAHVRRALPSKTAWSREGADTWPVGGRVMEALQVMSLVQVLLLKALLKVAEAFSLLSPLTQPQTTMPQTRPGGA